MKHYFLIILLFSIILFGSAGFVLAQEKGYPTIIEDYPELPACEGNSKCRPGEAGFGLPQLIKYIFTFSLGIVGITGLLAIIIAAFGYVTSVGDPQKAADAKDRIISALLGLLLLLGSYILLNIINPDLLKLGVEIKQIQRNAPEGGGGGGGGGDAGMLEIIYTLNNAQNYKT